MALPESSDEPMDAGLLTESDAPSAASASNPPWIISHFGFTTVEAYVSWLGLLDAEQLAAHIHEVVQLLLGE